MANYLKMPYAKNNQDPTPGSPTLRLSMGPTLLYFTITLTFFVLNLLPSTCGVYSMMSRILEIQPYIKILYDSNHIEWSNLSLGDREDSIFNAFQKQDESSLGSVDGRSFEENSQGDEEFPTPGQLYDGYDSVNESGMSTDNDDFNDTSLLDEAFPDSDDKPSGFKFMNSKNGMATCEHCGSVGVKHAFYSKSKRFCSLSCSRSFATHQREGKPVPKPPVAAKRGKPVSKKGNTKNQSNALKTCRSDAGRVFDWGPYLMSTQAGAASVSCFKHVPMHDCWEQMVDGVLVEVPNTDVDVGRDVKVYWIATVLRIYGYKVLLRYEGFGNDGSKDFWSNLLSEDVHNVGWCATYGKMLAPPQTIRDKYADWKEFLIKRLTGTRTIPPHFCSKAHEWLGEHKIKTGMYLEVVNKMCVSAMRLAVVKDVIGCRLRLNYVDSVEDNDEFWCHMSSSLIHPVGWSHTVGHKLHASHDYITSCLSKVTMQKFGPNDATPDMFPKCKDPPHGLSFQVGMKLEAIDPLNLSAICVATVMKVLRNNYLMIGIDGSMAENGSDWFCYHATSPCIFPVGFCEINNLQLTPPRETIGPFKWFDYLRETGSMAAPVKLFDKDIPKHGFRPGMKVEAVDLMEPRLICVATVTKVVGRLLRIHFDGWENNYDQWIDCSSPDIYPVGWCEAMKHSLEGPHTRLENQPSTPVISRKRKGKTQIYRGPRKKRSSMSERRSRESSAKLVSSKFHEDALGYSSTPIYTSTTGTSATSCTMVAGVKQEDLKYPPHKMLSPEAVAATLPPLLEPDMDRKPFTEMMSPMSKANAKPPVLSPHGRIGQEFSQELAERLQEVKPSTSSLTPVVLSDGSQSEKAEKPAALMPNSPTDSMDSLSNRIASSTPGKTDALEEEEQEGSSGSGGVIVLTLSSRLRALPLSSWSLSDVVDVLKVNGCGVYANLFSKKDVDGAKLQTLATSDLTKLASAVEGPIVRLCDLVMQVKSCTSNNLTSS
ncbi:mbt domain-containing protein 1 [Plakobranchus ocellatus]|uniref:Mbt domain-containing protein 1 n=1 Tax=Plakobranchus ocellatus TaxID=259542 RepID=A0AAV3Y4T4_9GAST|nr:mbt domain-containing protein 1 [Plakobranchus ocellatus]